MIDLIVTCDELDVRSGVYFKACHNDLNLFLDEVDSENERYKRDVIFAYTCNSVHIEMKLSSILSSNFIFVAYSHGNEKGLCINNDHYIATGLNTSYFVNTLFYSVACSIGGAFADEIVENSKSAFIGYIDKSYYLEEYVKVFVNCDNAGIKAFIYQGLTAHESFVAMKKYYEMQISNAKRSKNPFLLQTLIENYDALTFKGNHELTLNSIIHT